jgi:hypothetical protein
VQSTALEKKQKGLGGGGLTGAGSLAVGCFEMNGMPKICFGTVWQFVIRTE